MVRVMSEVHRYQVVQMLTEDGNKLTYSPAGPWVVLAPQFDSMKICFDAQRLRADTAEAELAEKIRDEANLKIIVEAAKNNLEELRESRDSFQRVGIRTMEKLAAAEQRIADQNSMLEEMAIEMTLAISDSKIRSAMTSIGRTRFLQILQAHNARIDAALNQKSEGESQ